MRNHNNGVKDQTLATLMKHVAFFFVATHEICMNYTQFTLNSLTHKHTSTHKMIPMNESMNFTVKSINK